MGLIHNVKGISRLMFVLLLLIDFVLGVLLSYIWTMGFYAPLEFSLPSKANVSIENVEFSAQDTSFFNITVLNPTYSNSTITVTKIAARTTDDRSFHEITVIAPSVPYLLERGVSQTFKCTWNWANYTDIVVPYQDYPVEIMVFIQEGSGATFQVKRPYVRLIMGVKFDPAISLEYFNVTLQNMEYSVTYVNVTSISVDVANITAGMVTPNLPYGLAPGDQPVTFKIFWNWTDYQSKKVTIGAHTQQGYVNYVTRTLPP